MRARPDEVRKMLVKIGFELTEPQQQPGEGKEGGGGAPLPGMNEMM